MKHSLRPKNPSGHGRFGVKVTDVLGRLVVIALTAMVAACGGGGGGGSTPTPPPATAAPTPVADCGVDGQKDFVLEVAQDWYKWYDEMADVDPADYDSAGAFLRDLTAPLAADFRDPGFSYLTTVEEDEASFTTGAFVGFGFRFAVDDGGRYLISDVYESGSAFEAGFVRGAEMLAVDRGEGFFTFREYEEQGASLNDVFGPSELGVERGFRLRIDDMVTEVTAAKRELDVPPLVSAPLTVERPGLPPVAYLHLRRFTTSAIPALEEAFAALLDENVTDFVIDLRYNGGGSLDVAEAFLDLLGGAIADAEVSYRITHNDKRADEDFEGLFVAQDASAAPLRIAFITTDASASASELVINSMAPHVEMVLVGSDTVGKAVGQYAFDQRGCETRLRLVSFEFVNGEDQGGFYTGLVDTGRFTLCAVEDQYTGAFGSAEEAMMAGALNWLNEGVCSQGVGVNSVGSQSALRRSPFPIVGENRPDRRSTWVQ